MQQITPTVKKIIILHVFIFLVQHLLKVNTINLLGLKSWYSPNFKPYQLFTYMLVHTTVMELVSTVILLVFVGTTLETILTPKYFTGAYIFTGIGAALLCTLAYYLQTNKIETLYQHCISNPTPTDFFHYLNAVSYKTYQGYISFFEHFSKFPHDQNCIDQSRAIMMKIHQGTHHAPIAVGSRAINLGLLTIFTMLFPHAEFFFFFFPIKAIYLLTIYGLYEILLNTSHSYQFLHLGGMLSGYLFLQWWHKQSKGD